jgi:hypothetical protein
MRKVVLAVAMLMLTPVISGPAAAQLGQVTQSPPPDGVAQGESAGYAKGRYAMLDALPDWGGIWFLRSGGGGRSASAENRPKLKGEYLEKYEAWRAEVLANNGVVKNEASNCAPPGMPYFMQLFQYPYEFLFTPGRVTVHQEAWSQMRTIWTDGRGHEEDADPSYAGDSVGHWEGDTLVVETVAINDSLKLMPGMGHSSALKITERLHLSPNDPNTLINEMTWEDPEALLEPFKTTVTYGRDREGRLIEFICHENDRNEVDAEGNTKAF